MSTGSCILVVEDEATNRFLINELLQDDGYTTVAVDNGEAAWQELARAPERFDAVLLDRAMPGMDGIQVLTQIKAHPSLRMLPVIMQTGKTAKEDILEGLQRGAYYYLTKPFERATLLAIVKTAVADYTNYKSLSQQLRQTANTLRMLKKGHFSFRTLEEGRNLASLLANATPDPEKVMVGLMELLLNAVEHGNLGITYDEKCQLRDKVLWMEEVERRLQLPENAKKQVSIAMKRLKKTIHFTIRDQGQGFDWRPYLDFSPERVFDCNGRGIAMARALSFDHLEYRGCGNEVVAVVKLPLS